jgi:cation:H+ antiporter
VAGLFLALAGAAHALAHPRRRDGVLLAAAALVPSLLLAAAFPEGGEQPFPWQHFAAAVLLVVGYGLYSWRTVHKGGDADEDDELDPLYFDWSKDDPPSTFQMVAQFVVSLAAIIAGAELFVGAVEKIAESAGISPLVLALVLAPLATEMPEKANSVLWVRRGKDALALGNITGAMTFQATIPVALGLVFTDWVLEPQAVTAAVIGLVGGAIALWAIPRRHKVGIAPVVAWGALFAGYVVYAAATG